MKSKSEIRKIINDRKEKLDNIKKKEFDNIIFKKVINSYEYKSSKVIFIFVSYNKEVDTHEIIKYALKDKKIVCVPKVVSKKEGMIPVKINNFEDLKPGMYGILEPYHDLNIMSKKDIDVSFIPGVGFDMNYGRVGYGGGFYDRFFKDDSHSKKIALAYDFQIFDQVPMDTFDIGMNGIITN